MTGAGAVWRKRVRDRVELRRATEALRLLGPASVRLLAVEGDVLVLERVRPGGRADELPDEVGAVALAETLPRLWAPVPAGCGLPTVEQECRPLADPRAVAPLPAGVVHAARTTLAALLQDAPTSCVLHGDLHPGNLLRSAERGWVAVDPHGLVGDPGYDVGPWLINPWEADAARLLDRRLGQLAELLPVSRERLAAWGLVRAVLAEAWHVQATGRVAGGPLQVAELLAVGC